MRHIFIAALVLLLTGSNVIGASLPGQASKNCAIPASVDIDAATKSADTPFLGIFDGKWNNVLPVTIIIYEVNRGKVKGLYAWKAAKAWNVTAGCASISGTATADTMKIGKYNMIFTVAGRALKGIYNFDQGNGQILVETSNFSRKR